MPNAVNPIKITSWNAYSTRFVNAPVFTWDAIPAAAIYRVGVAGARQRRAAWFETEKAAFDFTPIWGSLPHGRIDMLIHVYDKRKQRLDDGTTYAGAPYAPKSFYKVPAWNGDQPAPLEWEEVLHKNIAFLLKPPQDEVRPYEAGLSRFIWSCVETLGGRRADSEGSMLNYPSRNAMFATCLLRFAAMYPESPLAAEARRQAIQYGDWLYTYHLPDDYVYSGFPFSTVRDGNVSENASACGFENIKTEEGKHISVDMAATVGQGMLALSEAVGDKRYLEYARHLAGVFVRLQRADGSWSARVNPKTGEASNKEAEYSAGVVRIARFLAQMDRAAPGDALRKACRKAIAWTLANPVKTKCWQSVFEDAASRVPYRNLSAMDTCIAIRTLLPFRNEISNAVDICGALNTFIEDQFVVWDVEDSHIHVQCPTPMVLEQYICYAPMPGHTANWLVSLAALHSMTGDMGYLHKGIAAANAICRSQYPSGMFSTWGMDLRFDYPLSDAEDWPCCDAIASEALMLWNRYYRSVQNGQPELFDLLGFFGV